MTAVWLTQEENVQEFLRKQNGSLLVAPEARIWCESSLFSLKRGPAHSIPSTGSSHSQGHEGRQCVSPLLSTTAYTWHIHFKQGPFTQWFQKCQLLMVGEQSRTESSCHGGQEAKRRPVCAKKGFLPLPFISSRPMGWCHLHHTECRL